MAPQYQFFQCGARPRCGVDPSCRCTSRRGGEDWEYADAARPVIDTDLPLLHNEREQPDPVAQLEVDEGKPIARELTAAALGELKLSLEPSQRAQVPDDASEKLEEQSVDAKSACTTPAARLHKTRSTSDLVGQTGSTQVLQRGRTVGSLASLSSSKSTTASAASTSAAQGHLQYAAGWAAQERGIPENGMGASKAPRRLLSCETMDAPEAASTSRQRARTDSPPELRRWHSALDMPVGPKWRKARKGRHKRLNRSASVESRQTSSAASTQTEGELRSPPTRVSRGPPPLVSPLSRRLNQFATKLSTFAGINANRIATVSASRDGSPSKNFCSPQNAVIIFDWDDTLCPTYWAGSNRTVEALEASRQQLIDHAQAVRTLLRTAHSVARVAIVTLATLDWVKASARRFLLNVDLEGLLRELDITVHSAKLDLKMTKRTQDPRVVAKRRAMNTCLKKMYGWSTVAWNVISVGDSTIERSALQELLKDESISHATYCKTVKMDSDPSLGELTKQVKMITPLLKSMVHEEAGFDRTRLHLEHDRGCNSFSL
mmetsp:Transcript_9312/g.21514  ORF Transcript_9312/g.21514 Transcript_9312/m.21514 type:complete len:547 (+) Transcript_9312:72-1712(+)